MKKGLKNGSVFVRCAQYCFFVLGKSEAIFLCVCVYRPVTMLMWRRLLFAHFTTHINKPYSVWLQHRPLFAMTWFDLDWIWLSFCISKMLNSPVKGFPKHMSVRIHFHASKCWISKLIYSNRSCWFVYAFSVFFFALSHFENKRFHHIWLYIWKNWGPFLLAHWKCGLKLFECTKKNCKIL